MNRLQRRAAKSKKKTRYRGLSKRQVLNLIAGDKESYDT